MKRILTYCMALMITGNACKKNDTGNSGLPAQELLNISYGGDVQQRMDIYLPSGRNTVGTKALIMIHGGAWVSGDKSELNSTIASLRSILPDYAFFNINYRLATVSTNHWPVQINDVDAAIDFILARADEYKFNKNTVAIGGASAGAHLALLHAYNNPASNLRAVVDMFGPVEMKELYDASTGNTQMLLALFMGGTPAANPAAYVNASPLYSVSSTSPPTLILHGTADNVVPVSQSDSLSNRLTNAGIIKQYEKYPGEGHGIWSASNTIDAYAKIGAFLKLHVK